MATFSTSKRGESLIKQSLRSTGLTGPLLDLGLRPPGPQQRYQIEGLVSEINFSGDIVVCSLAVGGFSLEALV